MIAIDKLLKIIIVVFVVLLVLAGLYKADVNRYLRNVIPDYTTPEHEEISVEEVDGVCGEGWTMVAKGVSGNKIAFCGDKFCSEGGLVESEILVKEEYLYSNLKWWRDDSPIGKINEDGIFEIEDDIFLGKGELFERVKGFLPDYEYLINLNGAKLSGSFICREGERLKIENINKKIIEEMKECEVDENNLVLDKSACDCLNKDDISFLEIGGYGEFGDWSCGGGDYCYYGEEGCLEFPKILAKDFKFNLVKRKWDEDVHYEVVVPSGFFKNGKVPSILGEKRMFKKGDNLIVHSMGNEINPSMLILSDGSIWLGESFYNIYIDKDYIKLDKSSAYYINNANPFKTLNFVEGDVPEGWRVKSKFYSSGLGMDIKQFNILMEGLK